MLSFSYGICIIIILISVSLQYEARQQRSQGTDAAPAPPKPPVPPNTNGQIEYRLNRLEIILVEKLDNLRAELRDTTRRLQAVEWQSAETHSTIDSIRTDLNRLMHQSSTSTTTSTFINQEDGAKVEQRVENLTKTIQLLVAANRVAVADITAIKTNLSAIASDSKTLLRGTSQLVTKQFFNNGILDLKHRQAYYPWAQQPPVCPIPSLPTSNIPKNCKEVSESGQTHSGLYRIKPEHASAPFMVMCDLETRGGGWTVIQNRYDGSQDFYQNWHEYKHGFGNLGGEFWLGLDRIHQITGEEVNELLIELQDADQHNRSALYTAFSIGPEVEGFPMKVLGGYSGDAGDSLSYHAGSRFSAKDMDQDGWPEGSCAQAHGGAWWYRNCDMSNLNGRYLSGDLQDPYIYQGMYWGEFRGPLYSLSRSKILIRPRESVTNMMLDEIFSPKVR